MTSKVKSIEHVARVPGSVTCAPAGWGAKRTMPNVGSMRLTVNVIPPHVVPTRPVAVDETWKTPGSAPRAVHTPPATCLHAGTSTMPRSGDEHGGEASPALQTVFVSPEFGAVLKLIRSIEAGRPVWPTVTFVGNVIDAPAPTPACAIDGTMASTPARTSVAASHRRT